MKELKENIISFIENHDNTTNPKVIAVIGDTMMDLYDQVHVSRISPEFPIPVINCQGDNAYVVRPGGAGNVCEQFRNFNTQVNLCSILDSESCKVLNKTKINYCFSQEFHHPGVHVPIKRRYYDGDYPLVRMDNEKKNYGIGDLIDDVRKESVKKITEMTYENKPDAIILSDYNKGFFCPSTASSIIEKCRNLGIPTIVDPKKDNISWNKCTVFKPNLPEAAVFLKTTEEKIITDWKWALKELQHYIECECVVITAGSRGVFVRDGKEDFHYRPLRPVNEVRSVIGAGDCFVAVFALAVAYGYRFADAAQIAYEAGAVYVQNKHNEPIWPHQLLGRVEDSRAKILSPKNLEEYLKSQKNKRIIFTNGCFDILHCGHISTLEFAKKQGDILIVGTNTDESIRRLKGTSRPINELRDRQIVLAALAPVDFVTHFDEDTPIELIKKIKPHAVVKGEQYAAGNVAGHGICEIILAPMKPGLSTTNLIEKLKS